MVVNDIQPRHFPSLMHEQMENGNINEESFASCISSREHNRLVMTLMVNEFSGIRLGCTNINNPVAPFTMKLVHNFQLIFHLINANDILKRRSNMHGTLYIYVGREPCVSITQLIEIQICVRSVMTTAYHFSSG